MQSINTRTIVISSDGTGARGGIGSPTNVWRIHQATVGLENQEQYSIHDDGVGTQSGMTARLAGALIGYGVTENIRELYTALAHVYQPGARLYLFGFSRGAHTIRTLAGLITTFGILDPQKFESDTDFKNHVTILVDEQRRQTLDGKVSSIARKVRRKMEVSRRSDTYKAFEKSVWGASANHSSPVTGLTETHQQFPNNLALSEKMVTHTIDNYTHSQDTMRYHVDTMNALNRAIEQNNDEPVTLVPIRFLGLWDTVDSVGFPLEWLADVWNEYIAPFRFKDYKLSPLISHACQALSIDDARQSFTPRLIDDREVLPESGDTHFDARRIKQIWFSGVHSNVGGGYPKQGLAHISLYWMTTEAKNKGMKLNGQMQAPTDTQVTSAPECNTPLARFREKMDAFDFLQNSRSGPFVFYKYVPRNIQLLNQRLSHQHPVIDASVFWRINHRTATYSPWNLPREFDVVDSTAIASANEAVSQQVNKVANLWTQTYNALDTGPSSGTKTGAPTGTPTALQVIAKTAKKQSNLQSWVKWAGVALGYVAALQWVYEPLKEQTTLSFFLIPAALLIVLYNYVEIRYQKKITKPSQRHWSSILYPHRH